MRIEFIKATKVNNETVPVGAKMFFTDGVAQSFIDKDEAVKVVVEDIKKARKVKK